MRWWLFLILWAVNTIASAQNIPATDVDLGKIADDLLGNQDQDLDYESLYENLMQIMLNPIDLNKASNEDLLFLNILSPDQVRALGEYKKQNGDLLSIYELQSIPEFDVATISNLAPFVKVPDATTALDATLIKRIKKESDNFFLTRMERTLQGGHDDQRKFKGSPDKLYLRFRSSRSGDFSFGFTGEKDPGEAMRWSIKDHYYGLDYWSFHAQLQNKGKLKNLVVGDYQAQFGQGMMIGGIFGIGKGSETITAIRRSNIGILPYTSAYESGYLRGIASTVQASRDIAFTTFYSRTLRDGSSTTDTTDSTISGLQATGLHRTDSELTSREQIRDTNYGLVVQYARKDLEGGVMFNHYDVSATIEPEDTPYNQFSFRGRSNNNVGVFLNYNATRATFFGEVAHSLTAGTAYVAGALMNLSPSVELAMLYRNFDRDFHVRYTNAFGESSTPQNEQGIYWGWKCKLNKRITYAGYLDLFRFPWLRYRAYSPDEGYEYLLRLTYQPSRNVLIFLQAREETKNRNVDDQSTSVYQTANIRKNNYWIHCEVGLRDKLRLKTRIQFSRFSSHSGKSNGIVLMQDIKAIIGKLQITGRYAVFNTDDYDNRQYVYENDVLLAYSMPAYFGVGVREMLMVQYKINRYLSIWIRFASTRYHQREIIDAAAKDNSESLRNDLKFQFRIQF